MDAWCVNTFQRRDLHRDEIIGMGPAVVPLILSELEKEPDRWFWALEAITDENPVAASDAGDIEASARV